MEKKPGKKYTVDNENNEPEHVEEPFAGYQTLSERKAEFIHTINNMSLQEFERLEQYSRKIKSGRLLCQETVEEMREGVRRATQDYREGKNYTSHEEMKARFKL